MLTSGGYFDVDKIKEEIDELNTEVNSPSFWQDEEQANLKTTKLKRLNEKYETVKKLKEDIDNNYETLLLLKEDFIADLFEFLKQDAEVKKNEIAKLELELFFKHDYDHGDCILEIHSGAGGTEACDWALMLYRMYTRYALNKGYALEVLDYQEGEEAGIKHASLLIKGENAYGYLSCEKGVHRLVRLSPFDSNNRRHTSFASVDVTPYFTAKDNNIEIADKDLKIDVYRSSGAGGQSVNTTDSAVRITHLPTKIVVTCQNERSQLKNKEKALSILKSKLKILEIEKQEQELAKLKGENKENSFGSQIRSYIMHPYSLVKDHRTLAETSNVSKVLDGDLDLFIEAYLRR
mgnify:FL=1